MHRLIGTLACLAIASPLAAQSGMGGMKMDKDPTKVVKQTGPRPNGWMLRFDDPRSGMAKPSPDEVNFVRMGSGYHFTSGPAAIYYNPKDMASGEFTAGATFSQSRSMGHEAYGVFIGGTNLQDANQSYLYLVVRPQSGSYLIRHRAGTDLHTIVEWTADAAVHKDDPADGKATNRVAIRALRDSVRFLVNDVPVKTLAKADMHGFNPDGQVGLRVNHNLDIHVANFGITK